MKLSSLRADQTRRFVVRDLHINDNSKDLVLLVQWTGGKAYQDAIANAAFRKLEGDASTDALYRSIAEHVIVGWDNAGDVAYTASSGFEILTHLRNEGRNDRISELLSYVTDGDNFQRPHLVDAGDLGNA